MIIEKPFKILAIDGGGIKGLFSAEVIKSLEEEYGKPISQYFDLVSGTSTGGLIALCVAANIPAREIVEFYEKEGPKIFPHSTMVTRSYAFLRQLCWSAKYSNRNLKRALERVLEAKKMKDAKTLLCIPSYNLTTGCPKVFKSPLTLNGKNLWFNDAELSMVDVALATSAAPTYFPIHQIDHEYFTDGGVWCNNPALCGLTEALRFFLNKTFIIDGQEIKYTSVQILSISSVNQPNSWSIKRKKDKSAFKWLLGNKLLQPFMEGQSFFTDHFLSSVAQSKDSIGIDIAYKRISHGPLSSEIVANIDLDKANKHSLSALSLLGIEQGRQYRATKQHEIEPFFSSLKTFKN